MISKNIRLINFLKTEKYYLVKSVQILVYSICLCIIKNKHFRMLIYFIETFPEN